MAPVPAKDHRDRTISLAAEEEITSVLKRQLKDIVSDSLPEKQEVS